MTGAARTFHDRTPAEAGVQSIRISRTSPGWTPAFARIRCDDICRGFVKARRPQTIAPPALYRTPAQTGVQSGTRNRLLCLTLPPRLRGGTAERTDDRHRRGAAA